METLVPRAKPGGSAERLAPDEAISRDDALAIFTVNGARLMGLDKQVGALAPGLRADFIVTDRDPYSAPTSSLHAVQVMMTFIDGECVFDRSKQPPGAGVGDT